MERSSKLPAWKWAKTLLTRADCSLWRQDVEFVASLFNFQLRRDQIHAVELCVRDCNFSPADKEQLASLTAGGLVAQALASGEVESVRAALRRKGLESPIYTALQKMQTIHRNVRGSEAEKDNLVPFFCFAFVVWLF